MMKESPRSLKQLWLLLFVVALATRLFIFAAFHYKWNVLGSFAKGAVATDFEGDFWEPAQHIAHGDGCIVLYNFRLQPTAYYPPGQVYLYAGLYRLFPGRHLLAAKILQTLFVSLAFVLFGVYIEALFGRRVAWAAFALMNLSPFLGIAHLAYTVNSSALLLSAVFLVRLESFLKRPTYGGSSELGVWFGLMLLFNSSYIALGLAGVPWLLWKAKVSWKHAVLVSVVAATLLLPWAVRNYRVFGKFIPLRSGFKETFYYGNYPRATGGTREIDLKTNTEPMLELREKIVGKNEVEVGDILFVEALKFIREQPLRFVRVRLNAWLYFWTTEAYWIF
ncbi:MAG TPA: glycosyltransferase family 39 protein, partial [Elusimicrobiota bacterium]|nr:glycosyltransferase family 39 protein [Elusimicrobiota bacterium]